MTSPTTAREALIVEAIGDVAKLMRDVEALAPVLDRRCRALEQANSNLREELAGFERRMAAITENAKTQTVKHIAAHADEAARRSIDLQGRAMADAARVAFGAELSATVQRLQQATLQLLIQQHERRWDAWLTHAAAAGVAAAATLAAALYLVPR